MELLREMIKNIQSYILLISVWDIIDIVIVTFLVYKFLTLIRKTAAMQVIRGIALILMTLVISSWLKLNVLNFILTSTIQIGLIALVILFQPELRKMLGLVGTSALPKAVRTLLGKVDPQKQADDAVIEQTAQACTTMSREKVGALIVFERGVLLDDMVRTGTRVDAEVTSMLLRSLFFPNSALHDGAVIVRGGRIFAAGCMLPLTNNNSLSPDLGMRHRAGVGASEGTDAISVMVSEETGSISVAQDGRIKRHLSTATLTALLRTELHPDSELEKPSWLRELQEKMKKDRDVNEGGERRISLFGKLKNRITAIKRKGDGVEKK